MLALDLAVCAVPPGLGANAAVQLAAAEFLFRPKEVSAGSGTVTFLVKNEGAIEHNFILEDGAHKKVAEIPVIEPGEALQVNATLRDGTYTIYCSLPGHREAGMVATLRVNK